MKYIQGQNGAQTYLFPVSLDEAVEAENEVRIIDLFVGSLDLGEFGFTLGHSENGRPAYHPVNFMRFLASHRNDRFLETFASGRSGLAALPPKFWVQ